MSLYGIILAIAETINPVLLFPGIYKPFFNYGYTCFFLANICLFLYFLLSNKEIRGYSKRMFSGSKKITLIILVLILVFHIANNLYSRNPLLNLMQCSCNGVYEANNLLTKGYVTYTDWSARPLGYAIPIAFVRMVSNADPAYIQSSLGILISSLNLILIFLTVKHFTKKDALAIISCLIYVVLPTVLMNSSSFVENATFSGFFVLLIFYLYSTDNEKAVNADAIIFCTTLSLFFRVENVVFVLPLMVYIARKWAWLDMRWIWFKLAAAYLFTITMVALIVNPYFANNIRDYGDMVVSSGIQVRFASFYNVLHTSFPIIFIFFLVLGIGYIISTKRGGYSLGGFFLLLAFYLLYSRGDSIPEKYLISLVSTLIVMIGCGMYLIFDLDRRRVWKILAVIGFLILVVVMVVRTPVVEGWGVRMLPFSKIPAFRGFTPLIGQSLIDNSSISRIIFYDGIWDLAYCNYRFYSFTTPFKEVKNLSEFDYIIYPMSGQGYDNESRNDIALEAQECNAECLQRGVAMIQKDMESKTGLKLKIAHMSTNEYIYKIIKD